MDGFLPNSVNRTKMCYLLIKDIEHRQPHLVVNKSNNSFYPLLKDVINKHTSDHAEYIRLKELTKQHQIDLTIAQCKTLTDLAPLIQVARDRVRRWEYRKQTLTKMVKYHTKHLKIDPSPKLTYQCNMASSHHKSAEDDLNKLLQCWKTSQQLSEKQRFDQVCEKWLIISQQYIHSAKSKVIDAKKQAIRSYINLQRARLRINTHLTDIGLSHMIIDDFGNLSGENIAGEAAVAVALYQCNTTLWFEGEVIHPSIISIAPL